MPMMPIEKMAKAWAADEKPQGVCHDAQIGCDRDEVRGQK
jgi:hypothetical protein